MFARFYTEETGDGKGYVRPPAALQFAGPFVKECPVIVRAAVRWNPQNLMYVSEKQRSDKQLARIAIESPFGLRNAVVEKLPLMVLQHTAPELRCDADIVEEAVMRSGYDLQWASRELREDKHLVLWACAPTVLKHLTTQSVEMLFHKNTRLRDSELTHEVFKIEEEVRNTLWPFWNKNLTPENRRL